MDYANDHQGTITFNHDIVFMVVDVFIHHAEAGHRYERVRRSINCEKGEFQVIDPSAFRYFARVYSDRNAGGENGRSIHSKEESPAVTPTFGYCALFDLKAG